MIRKELLPVLLNDLALKDFFNLNLNTIEQQHSSCIYEDDDNIYVEVAVPGLSKSDITVNYAKGIVFVKGEKKEERGNVRYLVRSSENYSYQITIPHRIDETKKIEANCQDGILKLKFAKSKADKTQPIEIT